MHILFVPSFYPSDHAPGAGVFVRDQVDCVRRQGHKVGVAYVDRRSLRELSLTSLGQHHFQVAKERGGVVSLVRWNPWNLRGSESTLTRVGIRKAYRSYEQEFGQPDLVHAHFGLYGGLAALELKERFGIPFVLTEHSTGYARDLIPDRMKPVLREVFAAAERVVVVSKALRDSLSSYCDDIDIIPNVVDTDFFGRAQAKSPLGYQITTVGSLRRAKGFDVLLDSYARIAGGRPEVRLNIVGAGELRTSLDELTKNLGISDSVTFHGQLSRGDLRRLLLSSNLFVSSSRVETFGVAIAEAMACGLPVIATRSGGPQDIITSPELGALVPVEDAASLAFEMARAMEARPDLDEERAARVRAAMTDRYGPQAIGERLDALYRAVLSHLGQRGVGPSLSRLTGRDRVVRHESPRPNATLH